MADLENLPAYHGQLEADLQGHESLTGLDSMSAVVRRHIENGKAIGSLKEGQEKMVNIPDENSSDADRNAYYAKTGRPESFDKYEFDDIEIPDGRERDKVLQDKVRKIAFDKGVSSKALKALDRVVTEHGIEQNKEVNRLLKEQNEKDTNTLKNIWTGDSYKENIEKNNRTFEKILDKITVPETLGGKEAMLNEFHMIGFLEDEKNPHNSSPLFRYFMASMFKLIGDDSFVEGSSGDGGELSDAERRAKKYPEMVKT